MLAEGSHRKGWAKHLGVFVLCLVFFGLSTTTRADEDLSLDELMNDMSLEQLMQVEVTTVSKVGESLSQAPATVIVINQATIQRRGYLRISEILNDLPGMDVVRPWGDDWFKNYWRGYRNTIGAPYLVLLDGVVLNHLYFNTADEMDALPLSNIDRIEVVYGPASAIYGANAFMGIINIITRQVGEPGLTGRLQVHAGSHNQRIADFHVLYAADRWRLSIALRLDDGDLDPGVSERYEYTSERYLSDPALWGGFLADSNLAGRFRSGHQQRSIDARFYAGDWEVGARFFRLDNSNGLKYATDRAQVSPVWIRENSSLYVRHRRDWSEKISSTTLLRYRKSGVDQDSNFIQAFAGVDALGNPIRLIEYSRWQADNSSWSLFSDWEWTYSDQLSLVGGLKYERKNLQKAYALAAGPALEPSAVFLDTYPFPLTSALDAGQPAFNRITTRDTAAFVEAKWQPSDPHRFHLGVRWDHNSEYGSNVTLRGGYVGTFGPWVFKALYGEAFQEPNPRNLYGGWQGSGSDPLLDPESSRTVEVSGSYTSARVSHLVSIYQVENSDTIVNTASGAENLGNRTVAGADYHFQLLAPTEHWGQVRLWGYLSHIFTDQESKLDAAGLVIGEGQIGDLAHTKVHCGVTLEPNENWTGSLRARFIGARDTVDTNPIDHVPGFATFDAFVAYRPSVNDRWRFSFRISNLLDRDYFHPGIRDANAGDTPGSFDNSGVWQGSGGFLNSLLPQPGREFSFSVSYTF